jgi:hypothetical protein
VFKRYILYATKIDFVHIAKENNQTMSLNLEPLKLKLTIHDFLIIDSALRFQDYTKTSISDFIK